MIYVPVDGSGTVTILDLTNFRFSGLPSATGDGNFVWGPNGWVFYHAGLDFGLGAWRPGMAQPLYLTGTVTTPELMGAW